MNCIVELENIPKNIKAEIYEELTKKLYIDLDKNFISDKNMMNVLESLKKYFKNILEKNNLNAKINIYYTNKLGILEIKVKINF